VPTLAGFGMLACAAVAAATVAELVFLPALLVATDGAVRRRFPMFSDGVFGPRPATCLTGATEPSTAGEARA
jgi:hypothetical protein